jgi:general secretion pathway protein C
MGPYDAARMNAAAWLESWPAPDRWRELARVHGPKIVTWTLALLLGVQAALLVTDLAGGAAPPTTADGVAAPNTSVASQRKVDVATIVNSHLFGVAGAGSSPAIDAANAPQTSMPLVLSGIIAGDDPSTGLAILGESASTAKVYAVGDTLPGGAKLHSVHGDRVLLDRNGQLESLALPRQYAAGGGAPPAEPLSASENPSVERVRRIVSEQPGAISDVMRPQPVFAQGKQRGYRVYPGRNRQAFVRLGLRPGDLVTSINGTPLDDPARGQEIFQTLGSASEARVTVMRNGRQQDLTLNLAQVAQQAEQVAGEAAGGFAGEPPLNVPEPQSDTANSDE